MQRRIRKATQISILSASMLVLPGVVLAQNAPPSNGDTNAPSTSESVNKRGDASDSAGAKKKKEPAKRNEQAPPSGTTSNAEPVPTR